MDICYNISMKNLLFFDIECSNGHDICSFGYLIVDNNFNIIIKEDLLINPNAPFILAKKGEKPKIQLAYSELTFKKQPIFKHYYSKIKRLLSNPSNLVFGHSMASDIYYLKFACEKYRLPLIDFQGFDCQKLYKAIYKKDHLLSLSKMMEELNINSNLTLHKSCDDAHLVMEVLKKILKEKKLSLERLLEKFPDCKVSSLNILKKTYKLKPRYNRSIDYKKKFENNYKVKEKI